MNVPPPEFFIEEKEPFLMASFQISDDVPIGAFGKYLGLLQWGRLQLTLKTGKAALRRAEPTFRAASPGASTIRADGVPANGGLPPGFFLEMNLRRMFADVTAFLNIPPCSAQTRRTIAEWSDTIQRKRRAMGFWETWTILGRSLEENLCEGDGSDISPIRGTEVIGKRKRPSTKQWYVCQGWRISSGVSFREFRKALGIHASAMIEETTGFFRNLELRGEVPIRQ